MSVKIRTVFCGTPEFAVPSLKKLLSDSRFEVVGVVSQPDRPAGRGKKLQSSPVKNVALENNILIFTPESARDENFQTQIKNLNADVCIVVAYGQILNKKFLKMFPQKCVNIHSSLLPRWRGAAPMQRALMAGDLETGVSLQVVVSKLDAGAVIGEKKIPVPQDMNAIELHNILSQLGAELLTHELVDYLQGKIIPREQDESLTTHAAKISNEEAHVNWQLPALQIHNIVRGIAAGPVASAKLKDQLNGKTVKIHKTKFHNEGGGNPGKVIYVDKNYFRVSCGEGALDILEIQPESKPKMPTQAFLLGNAIKVGDHFE